MSDQHQPASAEAQTCKIRDCAEPVSSRIVILLSPDGTERRPANPSHRRYCERHTDNLLANLRHTYMGGAPALRVDVIA